MVKVKTDFVTNSSSTCFIVLIPDNFIMSDKQFYDIVDKESKWWDEPIDLDNLKREVHGCIVDLQDGKNIYRSDYGNGVSHQAYCIVDVLTSENSFGLVSVDMPGEGADIIIGIPQTKAIKIIAESTDLTKVVKIKE